MNDVLRGDKFGISDCWGTVDPSGFETLGFRGEDIEQLCELVRQTLDQVLKLVPPDLARITRERAIPLKIYATRDRLARVTYRWQPHAIGWTSEAGHLRRSGAMQLCDINGMLLGATPEKAVRENPAFMSALFHELVHIIICDGVVSSTVFNEAATMQIQKRHLPYPNSYLTTVPWIPSAFRGSTGFRAEEFSNVLHSRNSNRAWHITLTHALDDIPEKAIWNICTALSKRAHTAIPTQLGPLSYHPRWNTITEAVAGELGAKRGNALLETLPFQPLQNGKHTIDLPAENGAGEHLSFFAQQNPNFGWHDGSGGCDTTAFTCRDA